MELLNDIVDDIDYRAKNMDDAKERISALAEFAKPRLAAVKGKPARVEA